MKVAEGRIARWSMFVVITLVVVGCGALPVKPVEQRQSPAIDTSQTSLAKIARASLDPSLPSAFRLLPQAGQAFEARSSLIGRAEKTIDAQYYFIGNDVSGNVFLDKLVLAAKRGVRVRLLVDDLHTAEIDSTLAKMSAVPNLEVRLFNPFCCARKSLATRFAASILDVRRLNRRMHNKLLIMDESVAIAGGRNIADEYFARSASYEFIDIDALLAGDIVKQLGSIFERYWESEPAWPAVALLGREPQLENSELSDTTRKEFLSEFPNVDVLGHGTVGEELASGKLKLIPGSAYAFADSPSKISNLDKEYLHETSVTTRARETLLTAQKEVVISTPYLIPREEGMKEIRNLRERNVDITVLTNGRAANDSLFAYLGYARYRRQILDTGVRLYELSSNGVGATERAGPGLLRLDSVGRLHAKTFVVDATTVFIGSMNFDPRSADTNTELGILIESDELAAEMLAVIDANRRLGSYRVTLRNSPGGRLQWTTDDGMTPLQDFDFEPNLSIFDEVENLLLFTFVPESLL